MPLSTSPQGCPAHFVSCCWCWASAGHARQPSCARWPRWEHSTESRIWPCYSAQASRAAQCILPADDDVGLWWDALDSSRHLHQRMGPNSALCGALPSLPCRATPLGCPAHTPELSTSSSQQDTPGNPVELVSGTGALCREQDQALPPSASSQATWNVLLAAAGARLWQDTPGNPGSLIWVAEMGAPHGKKNLALLPGASLPGLLAYPAKVQYYEQLARCAR